MSAGCDVVVYVTQWCGSALAASRFLEEHGIAYREIDIDEDEEAAERVMALNRGYRSVPTIVIDGAQVLSEPSLAQIAEAFGIQR